MKILLAEHDSEVRSRAVDRLSREGFEVIEACNGLAAAFAVAREGIGLVLLDLELEGLDTLEFIAKVREAAFNLPIAVLANGSPPERIALALAAGARLCIPKTVPLDGWVPRIRGLVAESKEADPAAVPISPVGISRLVGSSSAIHEIARLIRQIAASPASTVLIQGESGTGKDLIAGIIHQESARASKRFLEITCTSLQEALLESELFGHEKGAFTDAKARKHGLFELAQGGTIFMNEIGDMSPRLQAKLLHALEEKAFRRVGGTQDLRANVRVIAATNQNLKALVAKHQFREDLYYRLNIVEIDVPPLRERREDILPLFEYFLERFAFEFRKEVRQAPPMTLQRLEAYGWPGNVRELRNAVEKTVLLSRGCAVEFGGLPERILGMPASQEEISKDYRPTLKEVLLATERRHVLLALDQAGGNRTEAAKILGISRPTLVAKLAMHGVRKPRSRKIQATE